MCVGAARAAPVEAYGVLPAISDPTLSPDGSKVAYVVLDKGQQSVVVASLAPPAVIIGLPGTPQKVRGLTWADETHLLVEKSTAGHALNVESDKDEWWMVQSLDIPKRRLTPLLSAEDINATTRAKSSGDSPGMMNVITSTPSPRTVGGRTVVYVEGVVFKDLTGSPALFSVDLERQKQTQVDSAITARQRIDWLVDTGGQIVARARSTTKRPSSGP
jgi:Tol biopolymer transport system component